MRKSAGQGSTTQAAGGGPQRSQRKAHPDHREHPGANECTIARCIEPAVVTPETAVLVPFDEQWPRPRRDAAHVHDLHVIRAAHRRARAARTIACASPRCTSNFVPQNGQ